MKINAVIGIDGGGSKTQFLLSDLQGRFISSNILGPSTTGIYNDQENIIIQGIHKLALHLLQNYTIHSVFLSLGGFVDPKIINVLKDLTGTGSITVERESSGFLISRCAPIWNFDIAIMAGTGSVAVGIGDNDNIVSTGGWGKIIDDRGSGFAVGKYGLRAVSDFIDGRGPWTALVPLLLSSELICGDPKRRQEIKKTDQNLAEKELNQLKVLLKDFIKIINRNNTAALSPLVVKAAKMGDPSAIKIINSAGEYLAELAVSIGIKLKTYTGKQTFRAIGIGGLFKAGEILKESFRGKIAKLTPDIKVAEVNFSLAHGAVLCALQKAGIEINNEIICNLKNIEL